MRPAGLGRQPGKSEMHHQIDRAENAGLLAQEQPQSRTQRQGLGQVAQRHAREHDPRIGKGEKRHDQIQYIGRQGVFHGQERGFAELVAERDEQCGQHAGHGGVHATFEHQYPQDRTEQQDRRHPVRAAPVQPGHARQRRQCIDQVFNPQIRGVEQRDDQDCAQIVEYRQRQQEYLQRGRRA